MINAAKAFEPQRLIADEELTQRDYITGFLDKAALDAGDTQADAFDDAVQLMTLHSAKGLEYPLVFIAGMEEGLFPHKMSTDTLEGLEEERRLCYVGITRAMRKLYVCYAESRRMHGEENLSRPSRFLREIPAALKQEVRLKGMVSRPGSWSGASGGTTSSVHSGLSFDRAPALNLGQRVRHPKFGEGVVLSSEGSGTNARIQVNFDDGGGKWLVMAYARLEII